MAKNNMLKMLEQKYELKYKLLFDRQINQLLQMCQDAAMISANEVLGMGEDKSKKYADSFRTNVNEIADLMFSDMQDDAEFVYSREKIDRRLKEFCGEYFVEWEERYNDNGRK